MKVEKVYKVDYPACRFIGKQYGVSNQTGGDFGAKWGEWHANNWFAPLEKLPTLKEAGGAYIGLMRHIDMLEYWIGMFCEAGTPPPDGYAYIDLPAKSYGVVWLYGSAESNEIYGHNAIMRCLEAYKENGMTLHDNGWWAELYNCPRFTTPDEHGNVILDYLAELA